MEKMTNCRIEDGNAEGGLVAKQGGVASVLDAPSQKISGGAKAVPRRRHAGESGSGERAKRAVRQYAATVALTGCQSGTSVEKCPAGVVATGFAAR